MSLHTFIYNNRTYLREKLGESYYDTIDDLIAKTKDYTIVKG